MNGIGIHSTSGRLQLSSRGCACDCLTSCCSTDSERPHRFCHLPNNFGSPRQFHNRTGNIPPNCLFPLGDPVPAYNMVLWAHPSISTGVDVSRIKAGAIDAAALGPFKKQAHGHGRENEKSLLYFGCDFFVWYNFGKMIKTVAIRCHILKLKCTKFDFGWELSIRLYAAERSRRHEI